MDRFQAEWDRLYRAAPAASAQDAAQDLGMLGPHGSARALVLELCRPADWHTLSVVWRGVQTELGLPAPAIAVSGMDGLQLWFSLASAVPVERAQAFLQALRQRYLASIDPARVRLLPRLDGVNLRHARPVPAPQLIAERWSAFVAPDLAAIFAEDPWLDASPSPDAQASVLARLDCTKDAAFAQACKHLLPEAAALPASATPIPLESLAPATLAGNSAMQDLEPRRFLQDVLNNPQIELALRIAAAQALLQHP